MAKIADMQEVRINLLKPYERNAKQHGEEQIQKLMDSIREFGFLSPCLVERDTYNLIAGHGRVAAAKRLGMETVPCVFVEDITEAQRRAYILADNRLTELGDWDMDMVNIELADLDGMGFDVSLTGFELELDEPVVEEDEYEEPEYIEPRTKLGDLWQLGEHRLICGDSTIANDIDRLLDGTKTDMCFTDPPYNVSIGTIKHPKFKQREILNDSMSTDDFIVFCNKFITNIKNNVKGCVYICAGQGEDGRAMFTCADKLLHCSTTIIWNKDQFTLGRGKYQNRYEPIWFGWVESGADFTDDRTLENVWDIPRPKNSELHPTMKPLEIMTRAMKHNPKSKTVLDLFGGSGSTLIACEQLNRKCFMCELDPHYCDVIIDRWETLTGKKAMLLNE